MKVIHLKTTRFTNAFLIAFGVICAAFEAKAYPEFIGYGYSSCVTCHYNTQGNGPLNDYGRALFAAEIASRSAFDDATTDEDLGESAGLLGKKELPWWLRPSFKYRGLWYNTNPGSTDNRKKYVVMQEDVNVTLHLDKEQKFIVSANVGLAYRQAPGSRDPQQVWLSREHYLRWGGIKNLFISIGMLDKVFGIRLIDHTAFSRSKLGINQYSNTIGTLTHGVVAQWIESDWELTAHGFMGNLGEEADLRKSGGTLMAEYSTGENSRTGFSILSEAGTKSSQQAVAIHEKLGLSHGSALLAEIGYHQKEDSSLSTKTTGVYAYAQTTVLLVRGYNLLSLAELYRSQEGDKILPDQFRWGTGFLVFPLPRTEIRLLAQDLRYWSPDKGDKDSWNVQAQLHFSF